MSFQEILSKEQKFAAGDKILTLRRKVIELHSHSVCCLYNNARAGVYLVECIGFRVTWASRRRAGARAVHNGSLISPMGSVCPIYLKHSGSYYWSRK